MLQAVVYVVMSACDIETTHDGQQKVHFNSLSLRGDPGLKLTFYYSSNLFKTLPQDAACSTGPSDKIGF